MIPENRSLTPEELGQLAKQMVEAKDPQETDRLQKEIVCGFYGGQWSDVVSIAGPVSD